MLRFGLRVDVIVFYCIVLLSSRIFDGAATSGVNYFMSDSRFN